MPANPLLQAASILHVGLFCGAEHGLGSASAFQPG